MNSLIKPIPARAALSQLREQQPGNRQTFGVLTGGAATKGGGTAGVYFSVSGSLRSEATVVRGLQDGLSAARATVAAAEAGARTAGSILDEVETVIAATEKGTPGSAFGSALGRLAELADRSVAKAEVRGVNLLKEGDTLNVTIGSSGRYDFKQVSFEAIGLAPTEMARKTTSVTRTVTEDVAVAITRGDRIRAGIERLEERLTRLDAREERIGGRIERLDAREARLDARFERLGKLEARIEGKLEAVGARPADEPSAALLATARRVKAFADTLNDRGSRVLGGFVNAVAEATAQRAGLTVSLDRLERMENRLAKVADRIEKTSARIDKVAERREVFTQRLEQVGGKRELLTERLEKKNQRLATMNETQLNKVVGTRIETLTREVTTQVRNEADVSFGNLIGTIAEKLRSGDTQGARALLEEGRARIERVEGQLGRIGGAMGRRDTYFDEVDGRLSESVKAKVETALDEEDAAARAAAILSDLARIGRMFSGENARPGIIELFHDRAEKADKDTDQEQAKKEDA
jgi:hypothetical protein